jgi:hypothetical protein
MFDDVVCEEKGNMKGTEEELKAKMLMNAASDYRHRYSSSTKLENKTLWIRCRVGRLYFTAHDEESDDAVLLLVDFTPHLVVCEARYTLVLAS